MRCKYAAKYGAQIGGMNFVNLTAVACGRKRVFLPLILHAQSFFCCPHSIPFLRH
ncbi:hypothetical protein [Dysosmobacter sp.]|uniref:hypothetical protein n=1 Tax=Dysosmobacter sp. TaxID=2591382 RepID=UPI003FA4AAEC